jgi:hypothetical protein
MFLTGLIFLVFISRVSAQNSSEHLDTVVRTFIKSLNSKGIDTVLIYQDYCVGCVHSFKPGEDICVFKGFFIPTYILWLDNGQTYMTKKDNCFDYSIISIRTDSVWRFLFSNKKSLDTEEIKIPQYIVITNGKEKIYSTFIDHSAHEGIALTVGIDTIINRDLDEYYFSELIASGDQKNINYSHNMNSSLKRFQLVISETIQTAIHTQQLQKFRR